MLKSPVFYGVIYFLNIILFSILYYFCFPGSFTKGLTPVLSLYFSIVTATTLGFGDLTPRLEEEWLLIVVGFQVVLGVMTIGFFLNAVSHGLSDRKDLQRKREEEELKKLEITQALGMLKPVLNGILRTLAVHYKVTAVESKPTFCVRPCSFFEEFYFQQMAKMDYYAPYKYYSYSEPMYVFFQRKFDDFTGASEKFLVKYSHIVAVDLVVMLNNLQQHSFLELPEVYKKCEMAMKSLSPSSLDGRGYPDMSNFLTSNYETIKEFHILLLKVIRVVDFYFPSDPVFMEVELRSDVHPLVGVARLM